MEGGLEAKINEGGKSMLLRFLSALAVIFHGCPPRNSGYLQCVGGRTAASETRFGMSIFHCLLASPPFLSQTMHDRQASRHLAQPDDSVVT